MDRIKVLVVDDSVFMRKIISDIINSTSFLEVIETASNGKEALEKIKLNQPDVVTLDIEMPVMDGLKVLEEIMTKSPIPVIMLSSLTNHGADATIKALDLGAFDFIPKPSSLFNVNTNDFKINLINKIKLAYNSKKKTVKQDLGNYQNPENINTQYDIKFGNEKRTIIAVGTSTGGPRALQTLLKDIPKNINASFLVVQHMPPKFTKSLAERLNNICELTVKEAENDEIILPGYVYIAPGDYHMTLIRDKKDFKISLNKDNPINGHRPSVDVLMNSIAKLNLENVIGIILTGMGSDGAIGLKELKQKTAYIIAQSQESCVVFGMPKSAINLGVVDKILPIEEIGKEITKIMGV